MRLQPKPQPSSNEPKRVRFDLSQNQVHEIPSRTPRTNTPQTSAPQSSAPQANPPAFMPRHSPFDPTFGPTQNDWNRIRNNVESHRIDVKIAEANHKAFGSESSAQSLAKAKRDLNASEYQAKTFQTANADFFRNPEAYRPQAPTHAILDQRLPPGVRAGSDLPMPDPVVDKSKLGWPANNHFSDQAAKLKKDYIAKRDAYQDTKSRLSGEAKRAMKRERDQAHAAYKGFENKHANFFRTGALDKEAAYRVRKAKAQSRIGW